MKTWDAWYVGLLEPEPYGDTRSYGLAEKFLSDCETVQDWGCGKGWFKTLRPDAVGVDGTQTPFSDVVTDLRSYICWTDGVLLRHVLEHNYDWAQILLNAVNSAQHKLCIILFTPLGEETKEIAFTEQLGVPDLSFALSDLLAYLEDFSVEMSGFPSATQYGQETILYCTR